MEEKLNTDELHGLVQMAATSIGMAASPKEWVDASIEKKNPTLIELFFPDPVKQALDGASQASRAHNSDANTASFESSLFFWILLKGIEKLSEEARDPEMMLQMIKGLAASQNMTGGLLDGIPKP